MPCLSNLLLLPYRHLRFATGVTQGTGPLGRSTHNSLCSICREWHRRYCWTVNRVALVVILCQSFKVTAAVNSPSSSSSPTSFLPPLLPSRSSPLRLFPLRRRRRFIDRSRNRARRPPTSVWRGGGVISGSTNLRQLVRHSLCQALLDGSPFDCSKYVVSY